MDLDPIAPPRRRRRFRYWLLRITLALIVLIAAGLFYLTRPSTLASMVLPRASKLLGGAVSASSVSLTQFDEIELTDVRVRVDGWDGEAGELLNAGTIRVRYSLWTLFTGDLRVRSVGIDRLTLRISERADSPSEFSLLDLKPAIDATASTSTVNPITSVSIEELILENGVATRTGYTALGELRFRGSLTSVANSATQYQFALDGRPDADGRLAIGQIAGTFATDTRAISISVDDLSIDGSQLPISPMALRTWTQSLGLEGRVRRAKFEYSPTSEPIVELNVEGVAMDLPGEALGGAELSDAWSGFADGAIVDLKATPRMTVREGTLRLSGDRIELRGLKGELGARASSARVIPLPFECAFTLDLPRAQLPEFSWEARDTWFKDAARLAPFSMSIGISRFSSPEVVAGAANTLQLPRAAAKVLSDFQITKWTINVDTLFERGTPTSEGVAAAIRSSGTLRLERASGAFEEFPYPLDDVNAVISFENDNLVVERLTGRGGDNAMATITGRLDGIATGAEIDLRIRCDDAPIDERLFASFDEGTREALELLFDKRGAQSLAAAGLLPTAESIAHQRAELARITAAGGTDTENARLTRSIDAGPFALGGRCGFNMRVYSPAGFGQPILVTGDVTVRDAGVLFERFPYPLRIKQGTFSLLDEAIVIGGGGLHATTPAGGLFIASGSVRIPRDGQGGRDVRPLIEIADSDDRINPSLLAAIPHDGSETPVGWPGATLAPAGQFMRALGLSGAVEMTGLVTSKPDGKEDFRVRIAFADGIAAPDEAGRAWLSEEGLPWPPEFTLTECSARLDLVPERVSIEQCTARRGSGQLVARGWTDLEGPDSLVELELHALPIDRAFEGYLAPTEVLAAERFARYGPTGAIDGFVRRNVTQNGVETRGSLVPLFLELTLDGSRLRADHVAGRIAVDERGLRAESLEFRLSTGNQDDGILRLSGPLSLTPESGGAPLDGTLSNARFESPLVRELLSDRSASVAEWMKASTVEGIFDAHYLHGKDEALELTPKTLSLGAATERLDCTFSETSTFKANAQRLEWALDATIAGGASGSVVVAGGATLANNDSTSRSLVSTTLRIDALALTSALRAQLPPPLDDSAEEIDLQSLGAFSLDLPTLNLRWNPSIDSNEPEFYNLSGKASFVGASFNCGLTFSELDAVVPIQLHYEPAAAKPITFRASFDAPRVTVYERIITQMFADIESDAEGDALTITANGNLAKGRFDVSARADIEHDIFSARVRLADADYATISNPNRGVDEPVEGRFEARVSVEGSMGSTPAEIESRSGQGRVSVRNARLADSPVALQALQLSQLMLPINASLNAANAALTIKGDSVDINTCELTSGTLRLDGSGTMHLPSFALAMRFNPKGTIPLLSDVIGGIMNQVFAIEVSGTLAAPKTSVVAIPAFRAKQVPVMPPVMPPVLVPATPPVTTPDQPISPVTPSLSSRS